MLEVREGTAPPPVPLEVLTDDLKMARVLWKLGRLHLNERHYDEAEQHYRHALLLDSDNARCQIELAWAIWRNDDRMTPARLATVRKCLETACTLAPYDSAARYCMAQYWRHANVLSRYRLELEAVLRCNPGHPRAPAELVALDAREERVEAHRRPLWQAIKEAMRPSEQSSAA